MHRKNPAIILVIFIFISTVGILNVVADDQEKNIVGLEGSREDYYGRKLLNSRVLNTDDVYSTVQINSNRCKTPSTGLGIRQLIPTEAACRAYALSMGEAFNSAFYQGSSWPKGCFKKTSDNQWYFGLSSATSTCDIADVAACACRFVSYEEFTSGETCHKRGAGYTHLKDATECKNYGKVDGAKYVGYASQPSGASGTNGYGFSSSFSSTLAGCHVKGTTSLFFNPNENTGGSCEDNLAGMCICKMTTPYNYVLRTSGKCTDNGALITSAWQCKVAAKMMGFSSYGDSSTEDNQLKNSSGCHSNSDNGRYEFNPNPGNIIVVKSGKCVYQAILEARRCKTQAETIGFSFGSVVHDDDTKPGGCYLESSGVYNFNTLLHADGPDCSTSNKCLCIVKHYTPACSVSNKCICLSYPTEQHVYTTATTGQCPGGVILTEAECSKYAHRKSIGFGTLTSPDDGTGPNGCFLNGGIMYHRESGGSSTCSTTNTCICPIGFYVSTAPQYGRVKPFTADGHCDDDQVPGQSSVSKSECYSEFDCEATTGECMDIDDAAYPSGCYEEIINSGNFKWNTVTTGAAQSCNNADNGCVCKTIAPAPFHTVEKSGPCDESGSVLSLTECYFLQLKMNIKDQCLEG